MCGKEQKGDNIGEKSCFISFPKLESLCFEYLSQWESWEGNTSATKDTSIVIMPRLFNLALLHCESLKALPDFLPWATIKELFIMDCKILEPQYQKPSGTKWDKISHIFAAVCVSYEDLPGQIGNFLIFNCIWKGF